MALFVGTVVNKVDRKGRVSVPATFRAALGEMAAHGIYVFPSYRQPMIEACGQDFMAKISEGLYNFDMFSEEQDSLASSILGDAHPLSLDGEGRIMLPQDLREHAGITDRAAFVGQGPRFQIWEPERLAAHKAEARERARREGLTLRLQPPTQNPEGGPA